MPQRHGQHQQRNNNKSPSLWFHLLIKKNRAPSPKRPPATRKSGNACTVCAACTHIFIGRFCKC